MTISMFDHPLLSSLLSDAEVAACFSVEAELKAAIDFEVALARATARAGFIPQKQADEIARRLPGFIADWAELAQSTARDGVIVPGLIKQMRAFLGGDAGPHLHLGATSQDVIDTALVLRIKPALERIEHLANEVVAKLYQLEEDFGRNGLTGVTRMQQAEPIKVADRVRSWRAPLVRDLRRLEEIKPRLLVLQFGGAVGTLSKLGNKAGEVASSVSDELGLILPEHQWHNQRDRLVEFSNWLALVSGSLGKIGLDFALMAQNSVDEIRFTGGGASSAMPHKQNPVLAEVLISLARYSAGSAATMSGAMVHEMERSGASWTLEWMVLPELVAATAGGLARAETLLGSITQMGHPPGYMPA